MSTKNLKNSKNNSFVRLGAINLNSKTLNSENFFKLSPQIHMIIIIEKIKKNKV